jgi:membrane protein insertase Oxa1/YidC/SpoIIIJ
LERDIRKHESKLSDLAKKKEPIGVEHNLIMVLSLSSILCSLLGFPFSRTHTYSPKKIKEMEEKKEEIHISYTDEIQQQQQNF